MSTALLPPSIDYSDRDFESLRARMFDLVRSVFPNWTDEAVANFANLLVESYCFIGDVLNFYQDGQSREGRFAYVEFRKNMIALTKLINYTLPGAAAATADVVLTISNPEQLTGVVVPSQTPVVVGTKAITNPVRGEIQNDIIFDLSQGEISKSFSWQHSITQDPFIVASSGKADQRILMPFGPFLPDTDSVETDTQSPWTRVDTFLNSGPNDFHYRIQVDQNERAEFRYGDGKRGAVPVGNITMNYKTGGGITGNVEQEGLSKLEGTFVDSEGTTAYLTVVNPSAAEGGTPRQTVDGARIEAPESLRVQTRTVAREDYEINAKRVQGVGRALYITSDQEASISENRGKLFIIPTSGGEPSQQMLDDVTEMCTVEYPNTVTHQFETLAAIYKNIDVTAVVHLQAKQTPSVVKAAIIAALEDFFEPMMADQTPNTNVDFGWYYKDEDGNPAGEVAWSDVFNVVRDLKQYIRKINPNTCTLDGLVGDVSLANWWFPALGNVTVINGDTGTEI